jgi:hypothetical protein
MQHSIEEVYSINGKAGTYTAAYLAVNGIQIGSHHTLLQEGYAVKCCYKVVKSFYLTDVNGKRKVFMYGEKTWFDTEEELAAYRITASANEAEKRLRNIAKKAFADLIDKMSIEEVKAFMEKMGLW